MKAGSTARVALGAAARWQIGPVGFPGVEQAPLVAECLLGRVPEGLVFGCVRQLAESVPGPCRPEGEAEEVARPGMARTTIGPS